MKIWSIIFSVAAALVVTTSVAQSLEYDDMYFNGKDRQKLKEKQAAEQASYSQTASGKHKNNAQIAGDPYADASAQYSARNQNPEFAARSNSQAAAEDADYFSSNYKYNNAASVSSFNNSYSSWYNSPWVANNYYGSSIYNWNSPYYGSYYDTWGNPWMNPYYRAGGSSSFSFYMGNSMGYGYGSSFGMGYGMGTGYGMGMMGMGLCMSYGNPYYNSWAGWGPSMYGYGGYYNYAGYPSTVIINDNRTYAYGKRGAQNGIVTRRSATNANIINPGAASQPVMSGGSRPTYNAATGGRVATNSATMPSRGQVQRQEDYYNRNWRSSRQGDTFGGTNNYSQPSRSSQSNGWNNANNSQSQWNSGRTSGGFDSGRSSNWNGGGGATRSSAPASSGSNGRTRGRD